MKAHLTKKSKPVKAPIRKVYIKKSKIAVKKFKFAKDLIKNNTLVTTKLVIPNLTRLPERGTPGQLAFNRENSTFSGWNGFEWVSLKGGGGGGDFERVVYPKTAISATVGKTIVMQTTENSVAAWGARVGGTNQDACYGVDINDAGDIVGTGYYFSNPVRIYNAGGTLSNISLPWSGIGYSDSYIAKWDTNGTAQWAARLAGVLDANSRDVAINQHGDIVAAGYYYFDKLQVYNGDGSFGFTLPWEAISFSDANTFVVKWNSTGTAKWGARISGVDNIGYGVAMNNNGDILTGGLYYLDPLIIYNASGTTGATLSFSGNYDAFVAKWNSNGIVQWVARIGGIEDDIGYAVAMNDDGDVVMTGNYASSPVYIYNADRSTAFSLPNTNTEDTFLVKWNSNGVAQWATRIENVFYDTGLGCAINKSADIIVSGYYSSTPINIYDAGGTLSSISLPNSGGNDAFIVKWNSAGTAKWATRVAGVGTDRSYAVSINNIGDVVATGYYNSSTLYIYNANGTTAFTLFNLGANDAFIAKWSSTGTALWAAQIGGGFSTEEGKGIGINNSGQVVVGGLYESNVIYIYDSNGSTAFTLSGINGDAFIVKYVIETPPAMSLPNPTIDGLNKLIASGDRSVIVSPDATVNFTQNDILLYPSTAVDMMWDATAQNWIVNSLTGTLV